MVMLVLAGRVPQPMRHSTAWVCPTRCRARSRRTSCRPRPVACCRVPAARGAPARGEMRRIPTTLLTVRWRRLARRLYRTVLQARRQRRIALLLALRLPGLRGLGVGTVAWLAIKDFFVDDMATYAAALAFHLFLALFPFVIFLVALLSFMHLPGFFVWLLRQLPD